jgi:GNAT superfamily N-acetyltransferase
MEVIIREAILNDWRDIQKLNNELFLLDYKRDKDIDLNWPFSEQGAEYYKSICNGTRGKCFVAKQDNRIIGYVALVIRKFYCRNGKRVEIDNMFIIPEMRSKGIGTKLLTKGQEWAKSKKIKTLYLNTYFTNEKAKKFYKNFGFKPLRSEFEKNI